MKKLLKISILLLIVMHSNLSIKLLADDEIKYAICTDPNVLKALNIVSTCIVVIKILIPVILIVTSLKNLFKAVLDNDDKEIKKAFELFMVKLCVGATVFFIPTLMGAIFSVVNGYDKTMNKFSDCGLCLFGNKYCDKKMNAAIENKEKVNNAKEEQNPTKDEVAFGKGCTNYVTDSSYNETLVLNLIKKAETKLGTSYSKMDCSDFVSYVYNGYVKDNVAAGLRKVTNDKCVKQNEVKPGDIFFTSRYDISGTCRNCEGTHGNRCNRYNCIMHVGIVTEVKNGKVTKILHSADSGVHYEVPSYGFKPNTKGSSWYINFTRPYA